MLTPEEAEARRAELEAKRRRKRLERRKRILFYTICTVVGLLLLTLSAYWSYTARYEFGAARGENRIVTVLLLGSDSGIEGGRRADTMILFSVDKQTGRIGALSIPRDTRVQIPGRSGYDRINAAHAYGGPKLAVRTVEELLGVTVNYFVSIDYAGFERIVDTLGGVVIDVEKPMRYTDHAQGLYIDLRPGVQLLKGREALQYVRYRGDGLGDVSLVDPAAGEYAGRVQRQLRFVQALFKQAVSTKGLANAPELISELRSAVVTDMPIDEAVRLALALRSVGVGDLHTAILPGVSETVGGASYWVMDRAKAREVVNRVIVQREGMVRVEVLNGNGSTGAAAQVADLLREKGFEVVAVGNADHFAYARTAVIAHREDQEAAAEVVRALGREVERRTGDPRQGPVAAVDADVTVIVGRDFRP